MGLFPYPAPTSTNCICIASGLHPTGILQGRRH